MSDDLWDNVHLHTRKRSGLRTWTLRLGLAAVLLGLAAMLAAGAWSLLAGKQTSKRQIVQISLLKPPPPPPPPPPPEVKAPEPEVKEEVKVPEPEQKQADEAAPASEQLGLDAPGSGSGDGFGLAAKKGGTDITKLGGPLTVDRAQFAWFTGQVQSFLQQQLQKNDKLRKADYRVVLRVWFTGDGGIERYELVGSSGNSEIDKNLKLAMDDMPRLKQAPPADMPQPLKLRVTSRGAG